MGLHGNYMCGFALLSAVTVIDAGQGFSAELAGKCFWFSDDSKIFKGAEKTCRRNGGELAQLDTPEFFDAIVRKAPANRELWVGVRYGWDKIMNKDGYIWKRGNSPLTNQWLPGEPNNSGRCVRLTTGYRDIQQQHSLADHYCSRNFNFICQKPYVFGDFVIGRGKHQVVKGDTLCPLTSRPSDARIECAVYCTLNLNCVSFYFNTTTMSCTLFQMSYTCNLTLAAEIDITAIERYCQWGM